MKILITRPRAQADPFAANLREAGLEAHFFPVIEIHPFLENKALEKALSNLARYDWAVFTSVNGVEAVWKQMNRMHLKGLPASVKTAAIGPKTAQAIVEYRETYGRFTSADDLLQVPGIGPKKLSALRPHITVP